MNSTKIKGRIGIDIVELVNKIPPLFESATHREVEAVRGDKRILIGIRISDSKGYEKGSENAAILKSRVYNLAELHSYREA